MRCIQWDMKTETATEQCMMQFVQSAVKLAKCRLNLPKVDRFIAELVISQDQDSNK